MLGAFVSCRAGAPGSGLCNIFVTCDVPSAFQGLNGFYHFALPLVRLLIDTL